MMFTDHESKTFQNSRASKHLETLNPPPGYVVFGLRQDKHEVETHVGISSEIGRSAYVKHSKGKTACSEDFLDISVLSSL